MSRLFGRAPSAAPSPAAAFATPTAVGPRDRMGNAPAPAALPLPLPLEAAAGRRRRRWWRSFGGELWRWLIVVLVCALLAPVVAGLVLLGAIYRQARIDQTRAVNAIVVLGTAQYNGRPGPVFRARLDRARDIYAAGYAPLIIVTGGARPGDQFTEAEAARDYLVEQGVPVTAILLENAALDSWQSNPRRRRALARPGAPARLARQRRLPPVSRQADGARSGPNPVRRSRPR